MGSFAAMASRHGQPSPGLERELMVMLCATSVALLVISPLASLALTAMLLINLPANTPQFVRFTLAFFASLSLAMLAGARPIDEAASNDIFGYYDVYVNIAGGDLTELLHFGGGFEVALPLLMYLWTLILPPLSVNGLMFCMTLTGALLMLTWVEKTFYGAGGPRRRPALMGICILMLNLYFATQLSRQFFSLLVLLFAFSAVGRGRQAIYLAIACAFHLTALPFYGLYLLARRGPKGWLVIIMIALLVRLYFANILVALDVLPEAAAEKLVYYVDNGDDANASDLGSLRMVFLLGAVSILSLAVSRFKPSVTTRAWLAVPWLTAVVHLTLLPIPLASLRTTLMVHSVTPGLIAHQMLVGRAGRALTFTLNVLLIYKVMTLATAEQFANLRSTVTMVSSFLH